MSGGIKPRGENGRRRNASLALKDQCRSQKGEDPSSILVFLCCGLSRSGDSVPGHGTTLGWQTARANHEMTETTRTLTKIGPIGFQRTQTIQDWICFSLSPITPEREWGAARRLEQNARQSLSARVPINWFDCFNWKRVLLLLLFMCPTNTNTRVWLTLLVSSRHKGSSNSQREVVLA